MCVEQMSFGLLVCLTELWDCCEYNSDDIDISSDECDDTKSNTGGPCIPPISFDLPFCFKIVCVPGKRKHFFVFDPLEN